MKELSVVSPNFPISAIKEDKVLYGAQYTTLKENLNKRYPTVLGGSLPKKPMDGVSMEIHLNDCEDVRPMRIFMVQPIPLHFQEDTNKIIKDAINEGIIARVDVPTVWCLPAFFMGKPSGGLHLVTDFSGLNK